MKKILIFLFLITPYLAPLASENLVIVQSVSNSKKTFVIRKGRDAGISKGQISLFSTTDISFTSRAKEVTRHYSLWVVIDKQANVPFVRDEVVTYTSSLERVWNEVILTKLKEVEMQKEENFLKDITRNYLTARAAWGFALSQSTSEVQTESLESRSGLHLEGTYSTRINRHLEFGGGIRYDKDSAKGVNPDRTIPSTRTFLVADVTYHFNQLKGSRSHLYAGIGGGVGQSTTTVGDSTKTGNATILPYFRFGFETTPKGSGFALLMELQIESVVANETFTEGEEQSTSMVNSKFSIGIRF